jgi:glyoxylase-like metal-dependent hydrolase (beta-lactamase superfamily II)
VHLLARERDEAFAQRTWLDRQRFRPQQWSTQPNWTVYQAGEGDPWLGFDSIRSLAGLPPEVLLVPLAGHTHGHAGVAVEAPGGWHLLAGDAYFYHREMDAQRPGCTPGLRFYQWMMEKDRGARLRNQARLRALASGPEGSGLRLYCSHDPTEFERLAGRPAGEPAAALDAAAFATAAAGL